MFVLVGNAPLWRKHCFCRSIAGIPCYVATCAGDPDPDPQDPHFFGPPGTGSGSRSFPFLIDVLT
jgi:hypothetical protein